MSEQILALPPPYLSAAAAHSKLFLRPEEIVEEALVEAKPATETNNLEIRCSLFKIF